MYAFCCSVKNPEYMKDNFHIKIDTIHKEGRDIEDNVSNIDLVLCGATPDMPL